MEQSKPVSIPHVITPEEMYEDVKKLAEELEDMTPEALAGHIRELVLAGRKSRRHRAAFRSGDLKALCAWERELTENYGVERKASER